MKGKILSNLKAWQKEETAKVVKNFDIGYCYGAPEVDKKMVLDVFLDGVKPNLVGKRKITSKLTSVKKITGVTPDGEKDNAIFFCETSNKSLYVALRYKFKANNYIAITQNTDIAIGDKIIIKVISVNVPAERSDGSDDGNKTIDKFVEIADLVKFRYLYAVVTTDKEFFLLRFA